MNNLTTKQLSFIEHYLETNNATESYRKSYNCENMKYSTISNNAYKLLKNNDIATRIKEYYQEIESSIVWNKSQMILKLKDIAYSNNSTNNEKINAIKQASTMIGLDKIQVDNISSDNSMNTKVLTLDDFYKDVANK
ncbi:terminase small subunit [Francisella uliginis]|uniref:Terminase n=1 Tax=Francisella uliginis TaxID=573570 RepID=A0A1L4BUM2_9GAMM|nr:terminase small subunit [Francisella uliginis]API87533.1 hypothetical protein F7310_09275 [Francisella uliginis]